MFSHTHTCTKKLFVITVLFKELQTIVFVIVCFFFFVLCRSVPAAAAVRKIKFLPDQCPSAPTTCHIHTYIHTHTLTQSKPVVTQNHL